MIGVPKPTRTVIEHFRVFVRLHPCCAHWPSIQPGDPMQLGQHRVQSEAAHVKSRGSGGDDERNLIPLCHYCHIQVQHLTGWSNLWSAHTTAEAGRAHAEWLAHPLLGSVSQLEPGASPTAGASMVNLPPFMGHDLVPLAPGVYGYTRTDPDGSLVIPMIVAEREGNGDVGHYLDHLPRDRRIVFEEVTSPRLGGMLVRRGFGHMSVATFDPDTQEWVSGYVRSASVQP